MFQKNDPKFGIFRFFVFTTCNVFPYGIVWAFIKKNNAAAQNVKGKTICVLYTKNVEKFELFY